MIPVIHKSKFVPNNQKLFNFVIPTYKGSTKLEVIINCLLSQTRSNYHITIVSDGSEEETETQLKKYEEQECFSYYQTLQRFNDYGHSPRLAGLYTSNCEYTIMSGFDNYYVPLFCEIFEQAHHFHNPGLMFCDFLLDHPRDGLKYNKYIDSKLEINHIDIGNFAAKTKLIKEVGLNVKEYAADWDLVSKLTPIINKNHLSIVKIPQTLYVHN